MKPNRSKLKTGWKVFRVHFSGSRVLFCSAHSIGQAVTYRPGIWIRRKPGCGPYAVFGLRKDARRYASYVNRNIVQWKDTNPVYYPMRLAFKVQFRPSQEQVFYYRSPLGREVNVGLSESGYPKGTCFADEVYLPWSSVRGANKRIGKKGGA